MICNTSCSPSNPMQIGYWIPWGILAFLRNINHAKTWQIVLKAWKSVRWVRGIHTLLPVLLFLGTSKKGMWPSWYPSGPFFKDKDRHPGLRSGVAVSEISLSSERRINRDTLISETLLLQHRSCPPLTPSHCGALCSDLCQSDERWLSYEYLRDSAEFWTVNSISSYFKLFVFFFWFPCGRSPLEKAAVW